MHFDVVLSVFIQSCSKTAEESSVDTALCVGALHMYVCVCVCVCVRARALQYVENFTQRATVTPTIPSVYMLSSCIRAVLISSPDT